MTVTSIAWENRSWMTVLSMYCTVVPPALPLTTETPVSTLPTVGSRYASNENAAMHVAVLRYRVPSEAPLDLAFPNVISRAGLAVCCLEPKL